MKQIIVGILVSLFSLTAAADRLSLSGHWQNANGQRFFFHHQAGGRIDVWLPMSGRQVSFEPGKLTLLSPADRVLHAAMYEINAPSDETLVIHQSGKACEVKDLSFSLLGLLSRSGYRGRIMAFQGVGFVSGTLVCGQTRSHWSIPYTGSWKRL